MSLGFHTFSTVERNVNVQAIRTSTLQDIESRASTDATWEDLQTATLGQQVVSVGMQTPFALKLSATCRTLVIGPALGGSKLQIDHFLCTCQLVALRVRKNNQVEEIIEMLVLPGVAVALF